MNKINQKQRCADKKSKGATEMLEELSSNFSAIFANAWTKEQIDCSSSSTGNVAMRDSKKTPF